MCRPPASTTQKSACYFPTNPERSSPRRSGAMTPPHSPRHLKCATVVPPSPTGKTVAPSKGLRTKSWTGRKEGIMYTREQKEKALAIYDTTQSITEVIRRLGYPSKQALYTWIANRDKLWQKPNGFRGVNTAEHPRHPSVNLKNSAIRACFEEGNDVQFISAQIGYSRVSIYAGHRRYPPMS